MEHVLAGVRTDAASELSPLRFDQLDLHPWLANPSLPAIHVTVNAMPEEHPRDRDQRGQDERREYESDRRGEHTYPDRDSDERPSQRERDELKKRMERGK